MHICGVIFILGMHSLSLAQFDEKEIGSAVALNGPVSIAFEVVADFQHYKSGVYSRCVT